MIVVTINNILDDLYKHKSELEDIISENIQDLFKKESDPFGDRWKPRKDTLKHPILNKTGYMKNNITYMSKIEGSIMIIEEIDNTEYGKYHIFGTSKMPSRIFLGIPNIMIENLKKVIYAM